MNDVMLPDGFTFRPATMDDAEDVAGLLAAVQLAEQGKTDMTAETVRNDWAGVDMASETAVVIGPEGRIVASVDLVNRAYVSVSVYGYVHPDFEGMGIGRALVEWGEQWTLAHMDQAPDDACINVRHYIYSENQAARRLLEDAGYPPVRATFTMEIDLEEPPQEPEWPAGMSVRSLRPGVDERVTHETVEDAFRDLWGRPKNTWERFLMLTESETYDPSLWFLAEDGDEVAGISLCSIEGSQGIVMTLGVRRPWRGRGLGLALLHHSFSEFWKRGLRNVWLCVDAESLTGANRLYLRAGMHVTGVYIVHLKELRPGVDYSLHAQEA